MVGGQIHVQGKRFSLENLLSEQGSQIAVFDSRPRFFPAACSIALKAITDSVGVVNKDPETRLGVTFLYQNLKKDHKDSYGGT
jgi:hypothetical protein